MHRLMIACSAALVLSLGNAAAESQRLNVRGQERTYLLERPAGQTPRPTIIMLHGLNGSAAAIAKATGLDRLGPQNDMVAVFPDKHSAMQGWNFFPPGREPALLIENTKSTGIPNDVDFLKTLVADLVRRGIADPQRVYLGGLSNGSFLALRMICAEPELFAGLGLLIGGMPDMVGDDCRRAKPLPVVMLNGTADKSVPYAGGPVHPRALFSAWSTERLATFFRELNRCSGASDVAALPNAGAHSFSVTRWTSCAHGAVVQYRILGGEHATYNVNLGQILIDFFRGKARS
jgi:polyhydroxybutyrate depolymerase